MEHFRLACGGSVGSSLWGPLGTDFSRLHSLTAASLQPWCNWWGCFKATTTAMPFWKARPLLFGPAHIHHRGSIPSVNALPPHILHSSFKPVLQQLHNTVSELPVYHLQVSEQKPKCTTAILGFPPVFVARHYPQYADLYFFTLLPKIGTVCLCCCVMAGFVFIKELKTTLYTILHNQHCIPVYINTTLIFQSEASALWLMDVN